MNTLLTIFIAIGSIGLLFLLISLVVGDLFDSLDLDFDADHDFDFDHDLDASDGGGVSFFNSRVISVFLTAFGGIGAVALQFGYGGLISGLFGVVSGFVLGAIVFAFGYFLHTQQASSSVTDRDLVGRTAKVVVKIQKGTVGQISCRIGDESVEKLARSRDGSVIKRGDTVFIEEATKDAFIVSPMEDYSMIEE